MPRISCIHICYIVHGVARYDIIQNYDIVERVLEL